MDQTGKTTERMIFQPEEARRYLRPASLPAGYVVQVTNENAGDFHILADINGHIYHRNAAHDQVQLIRD